MPARHFKFDVFLSHNRAQKDWTHDLAIRLRDAGFKVWFDEWSLRGGEVGSIGMERGLEESRHVVLVLSPQFIASEWTGYETQIALLMSPANRDRKLIPILHTKCDLPPRISRINWINFSDALADPARFEFRVAQLMSDLAPDRFERPTDFASFQARHKTSDPSTIPPVHPLPPGSRMPQASNPLFVGREAEMKDLNRMLTPGSGTLVGVHGAVIGMGGVGKTQLAIEYAHRYGHLYQGGVFWLNFAGEEDPINEVARCGGPEGMDIPGWTEMKAPEQASRVHKAWEEAKHASLLIFDNAEDPTAVEKWRPKHGHCSVLITCRRDKWPPEMGVSPLGIETLPREKSLELLAEVRSSINSNPKDRKAADKICDRVGDLPLALTLAADYLRKYKRETVTEYFTALSGQLAIQDPSLKKVYASFAVSYNKLDPNDATDALAQKLFYFASWFAPVSINRDLLIASAAVNSADRKARNNADDSLARLQELGLIKEEADYRLLLHRLLREFARSKAPEGVDQKEAIKVVGECLFDFAQSETKSGLPQALTLERGHLRELAAGTEEGNIKLAAGLYNLLGINGADLALFTEAKIDYERAVIIGEGIFGSNSIHVATFVNNLGCVLRSLGDFEGARSCLERALRIDEQFLGLDHSKVAADLSNLGLVLQDLGDLAGARRCYERAVKIDKKAFGSHHPDFAVDLKNLGGVLQDLGEIAGAKENFERALQIDESVYGTDHPKVATDLNNLGLVLGIKGDLSGARAYFERALKIDEAVYGANHPEVAIVVSNLARTLKDLGDLPGARANHERALSINEMVYGFEHPEVAIVLNNLAVVLLGQDNLEQARLYCERAMKIYMRFFGEDHPSTRTVQKNLDLLIKKGNKQKKSR